jgi:hypothetical protein
LERELLNIKESVRGLITTIAIFTNACVALVGVPPDPMNIKAFQTFHAFVAIVGFVGSSIHIVFYSIMMYQSSKSTIFKKYLVFFGIFIGCLLAIYLITQYIILEWILIALIVFWVLITALQAISHKRSVGQGAYYNKSQNPEVLKLVNNE